MLRTLSIRNFRGFEQFEMHDLGRVNLLVGTNNSGKTSVLEAIELLCSAREIRPVSAAAMRRGEILEDDTEPGRPQISVRHLFRGHAIVAGSSFSVEAATDAGAESVRGEISERRTTVAAPAASSATAATTTGTPPAKAPPEWEAEPAGSWEGPLDFELAWKGASDAGFAVRLTEQGGIEWRFARGYSRRVEDRTRPVLLVTTSSLSAAEAVALFGKIVLTPEETRATDALRIIDPSIERIAATSASRARMLDADERGGMIVRRRGTKRPIPMGSMGDGIWRMLGLALALARAENGVLLVDEIDTGLHFTVMVDMWKMVAATAKRLDVQVFATTHSRDCYESLAAIARDTVAEGSEVTIQRIEREKGRAVAYTEQEIVAAAEHGAEVR